MKMLWSVFAVLGAAVCLTGCSANRDLTLQKDDIPVIPVITTVSEHVKETDAYGTGTTAVKKKKTTTTTVHTVTGKRITDTASGTSAPVPASGTEETAAQRNTNGSQTTSTPKKYTTNDLFGKWETVSFSKSSGESIAYDLSDFVHRSYYVALDLNENGQSALTLGTESRPAAMSFRNNMLSVWTVDQKKSVSMDFTFSDDKKFLSVELKDVRVTATLKRINSDFSIRQYLNAEYVPDVMKIAGDWYYQTQDQTGSSEYRTEGYVTVEEDGKYIFQPTDGSLRRRGTIKVDYLEYPDGVKTPYFAFYEDADGTFWEGTKTCEPDGNNNYYFGSEGAARLFPRNAGENLYENYVGQWKCDNCMIQISVKDAGYLVRIRWDDSASEYREWTYLCEGESDNTRISCPGGGTLVRVSVAEDGTETRTEVFGEGMTSFQVKNGALRWLDIGAAEMYFEKIG